MIIPQPKGGFIFIPDPPANGGTARIPNSIIFGVVMLSLAIMCVSLAWNCISDFKGTKNSIADWFVVASLVAVALGTAIFLAWASFVAFGWITQ